jgi:hypothetical protein
MDCPNALRSLPFVDTLVKVLYRSSVILGRCRGTNPARVHSQAGSPCLRLTVRAKYEM